MVGTITCKSATCLVNDLESHYVATTNVFHGTPTAKREREECLGCGLHVSGVDWLCQVCTECVRCALDVSGVD